MLLDANELEKGSVLDADLCIIGAGAAGITLCEKLRHTGRRIVLLEAGGLEPDGDSQKVYEGEFVEPYHPSNKNYVSSSRLRYFGGTTNHWAGWCRPLDERIFTPRPWVARSGWPISHSDMVPYYKATAKWIDTGRLLTDKMPKSRPVVPLDDDTFETVLFHHSSEGNRVPTRFGKKYRAKINAAKNVQAVLNAGVTGLHRKADSDAIERADVRTLSGNRLSVTARTFAICAGGIENVRLLLASTSRDAGGLGNHNDNVGRYFADHPEYGFFFLNRIVFGKTFTEDPKKKFRLYDRPEIDKPIGGRVRGTYWVKPDVEKREKITQFHAQVRDPGNFKAFAEDEAVAQLLAFDTNKKASDKEKVIASRVVFRVEPSPNRESRVTLDSSEKDALGIPRARVHWKLTDLDKRTFDRGQRLFAAAVAKGGWGRTRLQLPLNKDPFAKIFPGMHHMGTTRMAASPKEGVVDADARVFGTPNLYVGGSSLFPTFGASNPTTTIVALALRLADHLAAEWKKETVPSVRSEDAGVALPVREETIR